MRNPTPERDRRNRLIGGRPTNSRVANKMTAFVFDHSKQMPIVPAGAFATGSDKVSASGTGIFSGRCMNSDGRSAMPLRGVGVGGSPDTRGVANFGSQGVSRSGKNAPISQRKR
jgi:hypothetical protein